ncbi:MAG TPA: hypothetical protein VES39_00175, partial [Rhodospirillales bacterium]|nr:hypothetical protein [Rhodospirillales bacterium]
MSSLRYRALLCSSAFAIAFAAGAAVSVPDTAHAQTKIYGAGGIGATRMFRRVFNCYSGTATTRSVDVNDPVLGANQFDAPQCTATANASVRIGLAPTTDSNSLRAFTLRTPSLVGDPNSFDQSVPYSSSIDTVPLPNSPVLGAALLS